jgi:hypothetical protein
MSLPENPATPQTELPPAAESSLAPPEFPSLPEPWETRLVRRIFMDGKRLRAIWSVAAFVLLTGLIGGCFGIAFVHLHLIDLSKMTEFTAKSTFFGELMTFLGMVGAASLLAFVEHRRSLLVYNLDGPRRTLHFFSGLLLGFLVLSALVYALQWGGWLHFGPVALSGAAIFRFGALWGAAFLLVGCFEEGVFRCFLLFTLARSISFRTALITIALACGSLLVRAKGNGAWGVYAIALLGLVPCLILHLRKSPSSGFWQATWLTSTLFGFIHTGNNGENWIGIFSAAAIGFTFCVSVRLTGSAWWAIGYHAAWDWAQTFFYGAADSGNIASGHYLTTTPAGNEFWSGGADGPEGSILVLGAILLSIALLIVLYYRRKPPASQLSDALESSAATIV